MKTLFNAEALEQQLCTFFQVRLDVLNNKTIHQLTQVCKTYEEILTKFSGNITNDTRNQWIVVVIRITE